jgi:hypothetical protein
LYCEKNDDKKEKLKNKIDNLIDIIKTKKNGKFLVFSSYDETFNDIINFFNNHYFELIQQPIEHLIRRYIDLTIEMD